MQCCLQTVVKSFGELNKARAWSLVGEMQSDFFSNVLITNNNVIASEIFHWLNLGRQASYRDAYAMKTGANFGNEDQ